MFSCLSLLLLFYRDRLNDSETIKTLNLFVTKFAIAVNYNFPQRLSQSGERFIRLKVYFCDNEGSYLR